MQHLVCVGLSAQSWEKGDEFRVVPILNILHGQSDISGGNTQQPLLIIPEYLTGRTVHNGLNRFHGHESGPGSKKLNVWLPLPSHLYLNVTLAAEAFPDHLYQLAPNPQRHPYPTQYL